jgi:hypothetical protein
VKFIKRFEFFLIISCLILVCSNIGGLVNAELANTNLTLSISLASGDDSTYFGHVDDSYCVAATLTSDGNGVSDKAVDFYYKVSDTGTWTLFTHGNIFCDSAGVAIVYFCPYDYAIATGSTVYIKAEFAGDSYYASSASDEKCFPVNIRPTSLAIYGPTTTVNAEESFTISAVLTSDGNGVMYRFVDFYYRTNDAHPWIHFVHDRTIDSGQAVADFCPSEHGIATDSVLFFKAEFAGDYIYDQSITETHTVVVGFTHFVIPEYPLGVLAALLSCFAAFVVSKKYRGQEAKFKTYTRE